MTDRSFWQQRWDEGRIGFHMGRPHPSLERFLDRLSLAPDHRVLVPLAGKAADLDVLARHAERVFANEYVERAAREYFAERALTPTESEAGSARRLTAGAVTFLCQDFFEIQPADLGGPVEAAFDRAALVAIDPGRRAEYAAQLARLVAPGGHVLLIVFAYDQARIEGPPFSVPVDEVHRLFEPGFRVTRLDRQQAEVGPKFHQAGLPTIEEHTLLLERA
jgi:thiopurine S-methyltransferase